MTNIKQNTIFTGDCLQIMQGINSESIDLIYLDPPFNSKRTHKAPTNSNTAESTFKDTWTWNDIDKHYLIKIIKQKPTLIDFISSIETLHNKTMKAYITYILERIFEMHRILKNSGSLYLHCDPKASHYLKLALDKIFGEKNFQNEIIWHYTGGGRSKKYFSRKHDIILLYSKTKGKNVFNINNIRVPYKTTSNYAKDGITANSGKHYKPNPLGTPIDDVWNIPIINPLSKERAGYPTQKPLALLERIIKASSNEGDLILDPFCGSATTCIAAQRLNRQWIGIDINNKSAKIVLERLKHQNLFIARQFHHTTKIPLRSNTELISPANAKSKLYQEQNKKCSGCDKTFDSKNLKIENIFPKSKGGSNCRDNYLLLCSQCHRIKQNNPMKYLRTQIRKRQELMLQKTPI